VPDWIENFQNPDLPRFSPGYARDFALRFPWVQLYTPVNEMYICATFSAAYGWWNEQLSSDRAFVTRLKHIVKANVLAMSAILEVRPDAIFIQSESSNTSMPKTRRRSGRPRCSTRAASCRSTSTTAAASIRRCTNSAGQRDET
jgi:hypothetical protein